MPVGEGTSSLLPDYLVGGVSWAKPSTVLENLKHRKTRFWVGIAWQEMGREGNAPAITFDVMCVFPQE
jgi:hypothetical protein